MPRVIITVPGKTPQPYRFVLAREKVAIGRGNDNDIVIDHGSASVEHAMMERLNGSYQLRDLGSTNHTSYAGKVREVIPLSDGTIAMLGDVQFSFSLTDEEKKSMAAEAREKQVDLNAEAGEEKEKPKLTASKPAALPERKPQPIAQPPNPLLTLVSTLLLLALVAGAFFVGMSLRHQKEVGRSLLEDIRTANDGLPQRATGAPSVTPSDPSPPDLTN